MSGHAVSRIGVFGGSFDPVHQGHWALAWHAVQQLQLDQVRWIPAGQPWQKTSGISGRVLAGAQDRCAMIELAIANEAAFVMDPCEVRRDRFSYTVETLREFRRAMHHEVELILILGQDQYARFHTWHLWPEILTLARLAVVGRDGCEPVAPPEVAMQPHRWSLITMPPCAWSSTVIRSRLAGGVQPQSMVPQMLAQSVARYIADHGLYRRLQDTCPPTSAVD